jgi:hypothetical protein
MILVAAAILVGVFVAATGRGGELASAPLDLGPLSASEVAALRPPTALWGYNVQVTDEALERIAQALRDRDVTISYLQQRLSGSPPAGPAPRADFPAAGLPQRLAGSSLEATGPQLRAGFPAAGPAEPLAEPSAGEPGLTESEYRQPDYRQPASAEPGYRAPQSGPPEPAEAGYRPPESAETESSQPAFPAPPAAPGE